jgi:scyllo-inositol 2-dehydrogenase (NADP+)
MSGKLFHAPFISEVEGFQLYGVWERSKKVAGESYPGIISFNSLEELLADPAIELVIVNTPNYTHFDFARQCLLAGKHVLVEKPFTVTVAEADELIRLAHEKKKILSVYQNRRYDSDYRTMKKVLDEGWLGELVEAEFHFDRYKEELSPKTHKETPGPGTGALYDLRFHIIDQALQLFGFPEAVFGDIRIIRPHSLVDDYFEVLLYYPNLRVRLHSSYLVREALPSYVLHGSKGSFIKARTDIQETALQAGIKPVGDNWGVEPESEKGLLHTEKDGTLIHEYIPSLNGNYSWYFEALRDAIRKGTPVPVTGEQGRDVIRIIEAAFTSSREGRKVAL